MTYYPHGQFPDLYPNDTIDDTFSYTMIDDSGQTDSAQVTVTVTGVAHVSGATGGDDTITIDASGATIGLTIESVSQPTPPSRFVLYSDEGTDTVTIIGSGNVDTAILLPSVGQIKDGNYQITVVEAENITIDGGGGNDTVTFFDSPGDDRFEANVETEPSRPMESRMSDAADQCRLQLRERHGHVRRRRLRPGLLVPV
ncbi:MAG: hypothetical protein HQ567_17075 [Candidatus Nealsonbacteria bacterium]|nr:hypothetical protein [Candidatus Nealsonbacteria bacterium]